MDPDALLRLMREALDDNDWEDVEDMCFEMHSWIRGGGFEPNWLTAPEVLDFYYEWLEDYERPLGWS